MVHLKEIRSHFPKITFRKLWNSFLVWSSYHLSRWMKRPLVWGNPISIAIEPTTACNLGCPECPSGLKRFSRPTGNIQQSFFEKTIDQLYKDTHYLTFYFQGEPLIHPQFAQMVRYASGKGMYTSTSTNAHFLDKKKAKEIIESGLDRLIISIDGIDQEVYETYRKEGVLSKVLEGTKNIVEARKLAKSKGPYIIFQFLVFKSNEHQIEEAKKLARELGVDEIKFKTAQFYDYEHGNPLMPSKEKYSRYKKMPNGNYRLKNKLTNTCWRMWSGSVITWDGRVVPCCFDKDAEKKLGDMKTESYTEIWKGEDYNQFRRNIFTSRKSIAICSNCSEGTKVWS